MHKKYGRASLAFVILGTLFLAFFLKDVKFNYEFESFFPTDDTDLDFYLAYRETFENDNDYLLLGIEHQPSVFDSAFLNRVDQVADGLKELNLVSSVFSLLDVKYPVISAAGYFEIPALHTDAPEKYKIDSTKIFRNESLVGNAISKDGRHLALLIKHKQQITKPEADSLVVQITDLMHQHGFDDYRLAGKAKAQGIYINKMQEELTIFLSISIVLVTIFLTLAYRTWWGVIVPLVVVLLSVIWIIAIMGLLGKSLDILMILLPTIMFVVGMSDVIHILTKYIEELRLGVNKIRALRLTLKEVGLATFLTSLTTSVGFVTLITASISPIREFGIYTAIGVFTAYVVAFTLLPPILLFLKKPKISDQKVYKKRWINFLGQSFLWVLKNGKAVMVFSLIITTLSIIGIYRIEINTYLIEDIPNNDPLKEDFSFFDEQFGGSRPFELSVQVRDTSRTVYDLAVLKEIDKVENYLTEEYGVRNIASPVLIAKSLNKAVNGGLEKAFELPQNERDLKKVKRYIRRIQRSNQGASLTDQKARQARISGKMADIGSAITLQRTQEFYQFVHQHIDKNLISCRITGTSNLIDKNNLYLTANMLEGLGIAFGVIAIIVGILFKSIRMIFITLIPNIIPLLIVAAIMGYFGITLKLSTSIIFTIAFGIAVDDTIHFTSKLKIELQKGRSLLYAIKRTYISTGKAIIITTAILSGGFLTLVLSSFGGTFYTGLLVSLTLVFAVLIDLTLLPVMVYLFYKR
ncbi:MAG: MMPL family transporter [Bacteroidota bacterium]